MVRYSVQAQVNEITSVAAWLATATLLLFLGKSIGDMGRNILMPEEAKRLPQTVHATVTCPICGKVIDIPEYDSVTRSEALKRHIEREHTSQVAGRLASPGAH